MTYNKIFRILAFPLSFLLSILSMIFPKDKSIWVFGAWFGQRYSDNSRYLFEYVCMNKPEIRAVWLTRNRKIADGIERTGREVYTVNSLKGFWVALRAASVFISSDMIDINPAACNGALKVQIWHGIPLKKIGLDYKIPGTPDYPFYLRILKKIWWKMFYRYDLVISSSPIVSERFATAFGVRKERILLTGYPRNDVILSGNTPRVDAFEELRTRWNADKVVFYAPTFRGQRGDGRDLFCGLDMQKLKKSLISHNAAFFIKLHFVQRDQTTLSNSEINQYHMHLFSEEEAPDINYLLPHTDLLITDYSSVYFDYLLLNRPIIFTPFDIENYNTLDREFYEDYDQATPGPKCRNWEEVIKTLDDILNGNDMYRQSRIEKRDVYHAYTDANSCERIVRHIKCYQMRTIPSGE